MILSRFLALGLSFMNDIYEGNEKLKQQAIDEYKAALLMPRKKKKKAKKSALLLYNIACYTENNF